MISFRSSEELTSSNSARASTPTRRRIQFDAVFSSQISGLKIVRNSSSGRATRIAVVSACTIEKIFGTCSPSVMCSAVVIR